MKATAVAPSNIAFIKYWGKKNDELRLPSNGSISMNLSNMTTTTTVEFVERLKKDEVTINKRNDLMRVQRVTDHLDRIRALAGITKKAKVVSINNFSASTGLSSSASAFAALTVAAVSAVGLSKSEKELSILARLGSGSACRSIPDGFTQWLEGDSNESSYAVSLFPANWWDIADVVAVLSEEEKKVPTTTGQICAYKSPFFDTRLKFIDKKLERCKQFIQGRNFQAFGELIEHEALELHAIMLTQMPPLIYLLPETITLIKLVQQWRDDGLSVYFTLNTGQNMHLMCQKKTVSILLKKLHRVPQIKSIIINTPATGTKLAATHLF